MAVLFGVILKAENEAVMSDITPTIEECKRPVSLPLRFPPNT
jgi:hypothetical protein